MAANPGMRYFEVIIQFTDGRYYRLTIEWEKSIKTYRCKIYFLGKITITTCFKLRDFELNKTIGISDFTISHATQLIKEKLSIL